MPIHFSWKELQQFIHGAKEKPSAPGLCCISFSKEGLALAHVIRDKAQNPVLQLCDFIPCSPNDQLATLTAITAEYHLQGVACSWLLQPADYKILNIETLAVESSEMSAALRWHIKDLIDFPIKDAAIDYFPAPVAAAGKKPSLNVVVTRFSQIQSIMEFVHAGGLSLTTIDIPELALRNCAALYDKEEKGLAFIWPHLTDNYLIIVRQAALYHFRTINQPNFAQLGEPAQAIEGSSKVLLDKFILDVQRSLDYYQSQLRQIMPAKALISLSQSPVLDYIGSQLTTKLEAMDISTVVTSKFAIDNELQTRCLAVIGGALRYG